MPYALVKPGEGETEPVRERGRGGARDVANTRPSSSLALPLSYSLPPPLSRSPALPLLPAPDDSAPFFSFFTIAVSVSFVVIVVFDGTNEGAAHWRRHPRIGAAHRLPDDLVEFDVGRGVFLAEI